MNLESTRLNRMCQRESLSPHGATCIIISYNSYNSVIAFISFLHPCKQTFFCQEESSKKINFQKKDQNTFFFKNKLINFSLTVPLKFLFNLFLIIYGVCLSPTTTSMNFFRINLSCQNVKLNLQVYQISVLWSTLAYTYFFFNQYKCTYKIWDTVRNVNAPTFGNYEKYFIYR